MQLFYQFCLSLCVCCCCLVEPVWAVPPTKPVVVVVLATGGTIVGRGSTEVTTIGYKAAVFKVDHLIAAVPSLNRLAEVRGEQVFQIGSENITPDNWLQLYYINANFDLMDVIANSPELTENGISNVEQNDKCSAFLKRSGNEIYLTHNSWMGFLSQSMTQTINVNGNMTTMNATTPGLIGSDTDFGYNNKGIMFNETPMRRHV